MLVHDLTIEQIRQRLRELDEPATSRMRLLESVGVDPGPAPVGGRVEVFDVAAGVAKRALEYLSIEAHDVGKALATINVLLCVSEEVLRLVTDRAGLPIGHVLSDLRRVQELVVQVGRIVDPAPARAAAHAAARGGSV